MHKEENEQVEKKDLEETHLKKVKIKVLFLICNYFINDLKQEKKTLFSLNKKKKQKIFFLSFLKNIAIKTIFFYKIIFNS